MLGCVTFALCFFTHPFQDAQKLAIINGYYSFPPPDGRIGQKMRDLIKLMFIANTRYRPSITQIISLLNNWDSITAIPFPVQIKHFLKRNHF
jgi:hypothetical protein